jgi:diketogulonate reductase-like aldo/keto reductase
MEYTQDGVPRFIYGTAWKEDQTEDLVRMALENGFRGIDTANQRKHYYEEGVGDAVSSAIEDGLVERSDLFIQTKFTYERGQDNRLPYDPDASLDEQVEQSLESSLEHLRTDYVDSLVLHGPQAREGLSEGDKTVWRTFEELVDSDSVERIGLSNVAPDQLEEFVEFADHPPTFVQNRCFARMAWDRPNREICAEHGIHYQGFSLLTANKRALQSRSVREIAERHGKTIPQVVFRFVLHLNMIALTGTTSEEHMQQDLDVFEFELTDEEIETIETVAV